MFIHFLSVCIVEQNISFKHNENCSKAPDKHVALSTKQRRIFNKVFQRHPISSVLPLKLLCFLNLPIYHICRHCIFHCSCSLFITQVLSFKRPNWFWACKGSPIDETTSIQAWAPSGCRSIEKHNRASLQLCSFFCVWKIIGWQWVRKEVERQIQGPNKR